MSDAPAHSRLRRRLVVLGVAVVLGWVAFFDSHSVVRRVGYLIEARQLSAENARLEAEIAVLEQRLEAGLTAPLVEEVAREQYGMRRPGETVYRVEDAE